MQFHTELTPDNLPVPLRLTDRILTTGSCFAEVMGNRLATHKLTVLNNPFGTVFNPVSMAKQLLLALSGQQPDEQLYLEREGLWFHYDFHSSLWAHTREDLAALLTERLAQVGTALRQANWLLLTLGTAVVYRHINTGQVVANCHKQPGHLFEKYLYHIDHVRDEMTRLLKALRRANPTLRVLLTVSPVRHTRDTLPLNQVSKSTLRVVAHELTTWNEGVQYFPAYELMQDDLRDYRFYEADLIHPTAQAHDYIFEKFAQSAFDAELRHFIAEWGAIRQALAHRPLHTQSPAYGQFLTKLLTRLDALPSCIDTSAERKWLLDCITDNVRV